MSWTSHGHWTGHGEPTRPLPPLYPCGGPHLCPTCALEAHRAAEEDPSMLLSVGADAEDVARLIAMLRAVGKFGRRLDHIADECARDLEALTVAEADDEAEHQRADDDGWKPTD